MKIKVGITGQTGFIGQHLFNYLQLKDNEIELIHFRKEYFSNINLLVRFVESCDTLIHLAGANRSEPEIVYKTNINLSKLLIQALDKSKSHPHIIFSSSTQEKNYNTYGESKREARLLFENWAKSNHSRITSLMIPNVFGPFSKPFYNTVVATFCYQAINRLEPEIKIDAVLELVYINDLVEYIYKIIVNPPKEILVFQANITKIKVSDILNLLLKYKELYIESNIIPDLKNKFEVSLFNTFRTFIPENFYPVKLMLHKDERGYLFEGLKTKISGQLFYSTTKPGVTRGNHFHRRKIERFLVVEGEALIKVRKIGTDKISSYKVNGKNPMTIDMPVWHTHSITNIGDKNMNTIFWINEFFDPEDSDTFYESVD